MFKNYLTIALRQVRKQKMYSAIKIGGFALSIAACLLIALYIRDEMSYDRSYPYKDRLFRLSAPTMTMVRSRPMPTGRRQQPRR